MQVAHGELQEVQIEFTEIDPTRQFNTHVLFDNYKL